MKPPEMGFNPEQLNKQGSTRDRSEEGIESGAKETGEAARFREQAVEIEKSVLGKFRGRAKEVAGVLMLISALSFTPGIVKEAYAGQREGGTMIGSVEKEKTKEEKAIDFLENLRRIPDDPRARNPAHNEALKEEAAEVLLRLYALQRKGLTSGSPSSSEIMSALEELNGVSGLYADKIFGNNDGKIDIEEIQKLQQEIRGNAGLRAFMEMYLQYSKLYHRPK